MVRVKVDSDKEKVLHDFNVKDIKVIKRASDNFEKIDGEILKGLEDN